MVLIVQDQKAVSLEPRESWGCSRQNQEAEFLHGLLDDHVHMPKIKIQMYTPVQSRKQTS